MVSRRGYRLYSLLLILLLLLLPVSCVSPPKTVPENARGIVETANSLIGSPYCYGGEGPSCFDCSGFVRFVFDSNGISIPRSSREQMKVGERIPGGKSLRPGDILFFRISKKIMHSGIYLGSGSFVHAPRSGGRVRRELWGGYWEKHFLFARRVQ